ncbi:TlpA disulfide reductase family protein [Mesorhizobium sp. B2-3-5]|uniref:TlpA disulfide reductase family protein n=1 Tax=Mesorhizobium sp. B2-3-5 TaxID=2589958 RepID=UPI0011296BE0|nr:TlpA disulfide reductase family protein [Mesorhizobium sp. B2-3-5]TPM26928.1 TlpA family protein disulfide reductase [Mesorhizobium sp. B2-3-5]
MNAITLGPLMLPIDRFSAILAAVAFLLVADILARRVDRRFSTWSSWATAIYFVMARVGHVLQHLESFATEPWRIFAVNQGGFSWPVGLFGLVLFSVVFLRKVKMVTWSLIPIALSGVVGAATLQLGVVPTGLMLPNQTFPLMDGRSLRPSSLSGRPMVINLWASWCPPCRQEMPMMAELAQNSGAATFIFANQGEGDTAISDFLTKANIKLDNLVLDRSLVFQQHYDVLGLPATLFIDSDGVLRDLHLGEISKEILVTKIKELQ